MSSQIAKPERAEVRLCADAVLRLTRTELNHLEAALDKEPAVVPQLLAVLRRFGRDHQVEQQGRRLAR